MLASYLRKRNSRIALDIRKTYNANIDNLTEEEAKIASRNKIIELEALRQQNNGMLMFMSLVNEMPNMQENFTFDELLEHYNKKQIEKLFENISI
jgi:hypothetical protein